MGRLNLLLGNVSNIDLLHRPKKEKRKETIIQGIRF